MKSTGSYPTDYDGHRCLRLLFLFWCVLLLQIRTWVLFVIAGSLHEQGNTLLNLFYLDHDAFWLGLLPGVPAVLAFLLNERRFAFPAIWRWPHGSLILAQLMLLCWQPVMWLAGGPLDDVGLALLVADIVVLAWLLTDQRLRACFSLEEE